MTIQGVYKSQQLDDIWRIESVLYNNEASMSSKCTCILTKPSSNITMSYVIKT